MIFPRVTKTGDTRTPTPGFPNAGRIEGTTPKKPVPIPFVKNFGVASVTIRG